MAGNLKLAIEITAVNSAAKIFKGLDSQIKDLTKNNEGLAKSYREIKRSLTGIGIATTIAGTGIMAAAKYQASSAKLKTIIGDNTIKLKAYQNAASDAANVTPFNVNEYMLGASLLERAHMKTEDIKEGMKSIGMYAVVSEQQLGTATDQVIKIHKWFAKDSIKDISESLMKVNELSTESAETTGSNFLAASKQATMFGISMKDVATASAIMGKVTGSSDITNFLNVWKTFGVPSGYKTLPSFLKYLKEISSIAKQTSTQPMVARMLEQKGFDPETIKAIMEGKIDEAEMEMNKLDSLEKQNENMNKTLGAQLKILSNKASKGMAFSFGLEVGWATQGLTFVNKKLAELDETLNEHKTIKTLLQYGAGPALMGAGAYLGPKVARKVMGGARGALDWMRGKGAGAAEDVESAASKAARLNKDKEWGAKMWKTWGKTWAGSEGYLASHPELLSKSKGAGRGLLRGLPGLGLGYSAMSMIGAGERGETFGTALGEQVSGSTFGLVDPNKWRRESWAKKAKKGQILSEHSVAKERSTYSPSNILNRDFATSATSAPNIQVKVEINHEPSKAVRTEIYRTMGRGDSRKATTNLNN